MRRIKGCRILYRSVDLTELKKESLSLQMNCPSIISLTVALPDCL